MSDTQAAMREFRFLDEKRKTNGLTAQEEQRWYDLAAQLGVDMSAYGQWGPDGQWYPYPPGYDPMTGTYAPPQMWGPAEYDPNQGWVPSPFGAAPHTPSQYPVFPQGQFPQGQSYGPGYGPGYGYYPPHPGYGYAPQGWYAPGHQLEHQGESHAADPTQVQAPYEAQAWPSPGSDLGSPQAATLPTVKGAVEPVLPQPQDVVSSASTDSFNPGSSNSDSFDPMGDLRSSLMDDVPASVDFAIVEIASQAPPPIILPLKPLFGGAGFSIPKPPPSDFAKSLEASRPPEAGARRIEATAVSELLPAQERSGSTSNRSLTVTEPVPGDVPLVEAVVDGEVEESESSADMSSGRPEERPFVPSASRPPDTVEPDFVAEPVIEVGRAALGDSALGDSALGDSDQAPTQVMEQPLSVASAPKPERVRGIDESFVSPSDSTRSVEWLQAVGQKSSGSEDAAQIRKSGEEQVDEDASIPELPMSAVVEASSQSGPEVTSFAGVTAVDLEATASELSISEVDASSFAVEVPVTNDPVAFVESTAELPVVAAEAASSATIVATEARTANAVSSLEIPAELPLGAADVAVAGTGDAGEARAQDDGTSGAERSVVVTEASFEGTSRAVDLPVQNVTWTSLEVPSSAGPGVFDQQSEAIAAADESRSEEPQVRSRPGETAPQNDALDQASSEAASPSWSVAKVKIAAEPRGVRSEARGEMAQTAALVEAMPANGSPDGSDQVGSSVVRPRNVALPGERLTVEVDNASPPERLTTSSARPNSPHQVVSDVLKADGPPATEAESVSAGPSPPAAVHQFQATPGEPEPAKTIEPFDTSVETEPGEARGSEVDEFVPSLDDIPIAEASAPDPPVRGAFEASVDDLPVIHGDLLSQPLAPASAFDALVIPPPPPSVPARGTGAAWNPPSASVSPVPLSAPPQAFDGTSPQRQQTAWDSPTPGLRTDAEWESAATATNPLPSPWSGEAELTGVRASGSSVFGPVGTQLSSESNDHIELASTAEFIEARTELTELPSIDIADVSTDDDAFEIDSGPVATLANDMSQATGAHLEDLRIERAAHSEYLSESAVTQTGAAWERTGAAIELEPEAELEAELEDDVIQGVVVDEAVPPPPPPLSAPVSLWRDAKVPPPPPPLSAPLPPPAKDLAPAPLRPVGDASPLFGTQVAPHGSSLPSPTVSPPTAAPTTSETGSAAVTAVTRSAQAATTSWPTSNAAEAAISVAPASGSGGSRSTAASATFGDVLSARAVEQRVETASSVRQPVVPYVGETHVGEKGGGERRPTPSPPRAVGVPGAQPLGRLALMQQPATGPFPAQPGVPQLGVPQAAPVPPPYPGTPIIGGGPSQSPSLSGRKAPVALVGAFRVTLHTMEGQVKRGVLRDPNLAAEHISLELQGGIGEVIALNRLKVVFFMLPPGARAPTGQGEKIRVTFKDGRQVAGFSTDHAQSGPGFFVVPADNRTNTERIYIYRHGIQSVTIEG